MIIKLIKLKPNFDKCFFVRDKLKYLGHVVDEHGLHPDPDKVSTILDLPTPTNMKELRQFLGMASWYRRFVKDVSRTVAPLTFLLKKKNE